MRKQAIQQRQEFRRFVSDNPDDFVSYRDARAIRRQCSMRPKVKGASDKSMIWNTAVRIGQLDKIIEEKRIRKSASE